MGPEELGGGYESLLERVPAIDLPARTFGFVGRTEEGSTAGNARKLTGSYYTPDSLVQELIRSALDPVIEQRLSANPANPTEALLAIRVIDPACGSGTFCSPPLAVWPKNWPSCAVSKVGRKAPSSRRTTAMPCARW